MKIKRGPNVSQLVANYSWRARSIATAIKLNGLYYRSLRNNDAPAETIGVTSCRDDTELRKKMKWLSARIYQWTADDGDRFDEGACRVLKLPSPIRPPTARGRFARGSTISVSRHRSEWVR